MTMTITDFAERFPSSSVIVAVIVSRPSGTAAAGCGPHFRQIAPRYRILSDRSKVPARSWCFRIMMMRGWQADCETAVIGRWQSKRECAGATEPEIREAGGSSGD